MKLHTRPFVLSLVALLSAPPSDARTLEVHRLKPAVLDIGGELVRIVDGFRTPIIHEVVLDPRDVDAHFAVRMKPRLVRPDSSRFSRFATSPGFIAFAKSVLRDRDHRSGISSSHELAAYFREKQTHTFALTGTRLTFALTGPKRGIDIVSKHAMISMDYLDVRFAGQMWREGDKLCFNANSGTYMKKRDESPDLNPAPEPGPMIALLEEIIDAELKVEFCREIAPHFGSSEAIDQAEKALQVVAIARGHKQDKSAEPLSEDVLKRMERAREAAREAYAAAAVADRAHHLWKKARSKSARILAEEDYFARDLAAAESAAAAKKARKRLEKILKREVEET